MTNQTSANEEVKALFLGTMPERPGDVAKLIETVQYERASDRPAMHLEAAAFFGKGLVVFTDRVFQQVWLIAYLAWRTMHEQAGFVIAPLLDGKPYASYRPGVSASEDKFMAHIDRLGLALVDLRSADAGTMPWPRDVPRLTPDLSELRDKEDRATYDLACFAGAFLLLHETCHALKRARVEPYGGVSEELECDGFAIDQVLNKADAYAAQNGHTTADVVRKRAMGLFLGLIVILESTERGLWAPSQTHPPLQARVQQLLAKVEPILTDTDEPFWVFSTCALLSKLRRQGRLPESMVFTDVRDLFFRVLGLLSVPG